MVIDGHGHSWTLMGAVSMKILIVFMDVVVSVQSPRNVHGN